MMYEYYITEMKNKVERVKYADIKGNLNVDHLNMVDLVKTFETYLHTIRL